MPYPAQHIATIGQGPATMTSLELVEFINSERAKDEAVLQHRDFTAKVPKVLGEGECEKFRTPYVHPQNGQTYQIYTFPKREACLMAMSYSYELQAKVFDRMTALEASQTPALPQTMAQALRLAAEQAEQLEKNQAALALAAPKVEFVDRYVAADTGEMGFRQVCKLLRANEARFRDFLASEKVMYLLGGVWTPHAQHMDTGRFVVKTGHSKLNDHTFSQAKFTGKGVEWVAGLWGQYQAKQQAAEEV